MLVPGLGPHAAELSAAGLGGIPEAASGWIITILVLCPAASHLGNSSSYEPGVEAFGSC